MGLINGIMSMTADINKAISVIQQDPNTKCVFVGDSMGRYDSLFDSYGVIPASVLMPDYPCMEADINGARDEFHQKYFMYLNTENPKSMIITLIAALHMGKNIILLIPPESSGLNYPFVLSAYLSAYHGIQVQSDLYPASFMYFNAKDSYNAMCLYSMNFIQPQEFLMYAGPEFGGLIQKLCYDTGIQFAPNTPPEVIYNYFNEWRINMIRAGKPLQKVFGFNHRQEE